MEQLTPEQRIEAYKYVLDRIERVGNIWICIQLGGWIYKNVWHVQVNDAIDYFPEFAAMKPDPLPFLGSTAWWDEDEDGRLSRIAALEQCIKECLLLINQPT